MDKRYPLPGTAQVLLAAALTDRGCVRDRNEDAVGVFTHDPDRGYLLLVADGLGGGLAGEKASRLAVDTLRNVFFERAPGTDVARTLEQAMIEANRRIFHLAETDVDLVGMGTTCTAVVVERAGLHVAHSGDSRGYLLTGDHLRRLTQDHAARHSTLDPAGTRVRTPALNLLASYLGAGAEIRVDVTPAPIPLGPGDRLLLCSDGLYNLAEETELAGALAASDPEEACRRLVDLARSRGGPDNISAVVAAIQD